MERKGRKIGPEIHCADLKLSRNLSAHVRKSGVDEVTMMHGWIIRYLYENREQDIDITSIYKEVCELEKSRIPEFEKEIIRSL